jgi:hypothetical protein
VTPFCLDNQEANVTPQKRDSKDRQLKSVSKEQIATLEGKISALEQ